MTRTQVQAKQQAFVVKMCHVLCVSIIFLAGIQMAAAIPHKYDALQVTSSDRVEVGTYTIQTTVEHDKDALEMVAYGDTKRWVVKVQPDDENNCTEIMTNICLEAQMSGWNSTFSSVDFNGNCTWLGRSSCFFTFVGESDEDVDNLMVLYEDHIEYVERDMKVIAEQQCSYTFPQNDAPWHLDRIDSVSSETNLDGSFQTPESLTGDGVHVYVLDTGLLSTHSEFQGRVGNGRNVFRGNSNANDNNGHGTAVAGVIAGSTYGVCKCCKIHPVKVLDSNGDGSYSDVIAGMNWVKENARKPAIASMSLSGPTSQAINSVIEDLYEEGIITIAAAGNENVDACSRSPGSSQYAITVGSSDQEGSGIDFRSSFSNYGSCVDMYAPGSGIQTSHYSSNTASSTRSGTSFSAPAVAGVAALYLQAYPNTGAAMLKMQVTEASEQKNSIENNAKLLNVGNLDVCPVTQAPQECVLSGWSEWSPSCPDPAQTCGRPLQRRTRTVITEPSCGGAMCPSTTKSRECEGDYTPCPSDFPTQWFGTNDQESRPAPDLDIEGRTLMFTPQGSSGYSVCIDDHTGYNALEGFNSATKLQVGDDSYVEVSLGNVGFTYMGQTKNKIFIGSNGYITLDQGDYAYMVGQVTTSGAGRSLLEASPLPVKPVIASVQQSIKRILKNVEGHDEFIGATAPHWTRQRIAALFQDMNPSMSGNHGIYFQVKDEGSADGRIVVTYDRIPLWGMADEKNTFQIVMYLDDSSNAGVIKIWYGSISGVFRPLVGLSPGTLPTDQIESNLIPDSGTCSGGALRRVPDAPASQTTSQTPFAYTPPPPTPFFTCF